MRHWLMYTCRDFPDGAEVAETAIALEIDPVAIAAHDPADQQIHCGIELSPSALDVVRVSQWFSKRNQREIVFFNELGYSLLPQDWAARGTDWFGALDELTHRSGFSNRFFNTNRWSHSLIGCYGAPSLTVSGQRMPDDEFQGHREALMQLFKAQLLQPLPLR